MAAGTEVFSAHHNEKWGEQWLPPEICTPVDFTAMNRCDVVCAVVGKPSSGGVAVELGWASALTKPILLLVDPESDTSPLITGLATITRTEHIDEPTKWTDFELDTIVKQTLSMTDQTNLDENTADVDLITGYAIGGTGQLSTQVRFCATDQCVHQADSIRSA